MAGVLKTMLVHFLFVVKIVSAQMNGEFWWLNEKVTALQDVHAPPVMYGDLNDLGTDESDMVIFRDQDTIKTGKVIKAGSVKRTGKKLKEKEEINNDLIFKIPNKTSVVFSPQTETTTRKIIDSITPSSHNDELVFRDIIHYNIPVKDMKIANSYRPNYNDLDEMKLIFPVIKNATSGHKSENKSTVNLHSITGNSHATDDANCKKQEIFKTNVENICTSLTIYQCTRQKGTIYYKPATSTVPANKTHFAICCILPMIAKHDSSRMIFPDEMDRLSSRRKRETQIQNYKDATMREDHRSFLFRIRLGARNKLTTSSVRPLRRIVTPDYDYEDPYWNIKNTRPDPTTDAGHDYVGADYVEDYVSELPTPGKLGSYPKRNGYMKRGGNGQNEATHSGYDEDPIVDDRSDHNIKSGSAMKNVDDLISTEEYDAIDPFVRYTADPDFQVLEGFKLLNLIPKNTMKSKNKNKSIKTTSIVKSSQVEDSSEEESGLVRLHKN